MQRVLFLILFLASILFPVAVSWSDNHWKSLMPDGEGKQVTTELCGTCHNLQKTVVSRKSAPKETISLAAVKSSDGQATPYV